MKLSNIIIMFILIVACVCWILLTCKKTKKNSIIVNFFIPIGVSIVLGLTVYLINLHYGSPIKFIKSIMSKIVIIDDTSGLGVESTPNPTAEITRGIKIEADYEPADKQETDKKEIDDLFRGYTIGFVNAINYNDFSYVESTLMYESPIYYEMQDYILGYCQEHKIRETIVEEKITNYTFKNDNSYLIDTFEVYDIVRREEGDQSVRKSYNTQYRVEKIDNQWYLTDITVEPVAY